MDALVGESEEAAAPPLAVSRHVVSASHGKYEAPGKAEDGEAAAHPAGCTT